MPGRPVTIRSALSDLVAVPVMAAVILWRHWPALIAAALAGLGVRQGIVWLGVIASKHSSLLAVLMLPLAGLAMLVGLILMLWATRPSLPHLDAPAGADAGSRIHGAVRAISRLLIPFIAVYASVGFLAEDGRAFVQTSFAEEAARNPLSVDYSRLNVSGGWGMLVLVAVALVGRALISAYGLAVRWTAFAVLGAYLEGLWLLTLASSAVSLLTPLGVWLRSRRAVDGTIGLWDQLVAALGPWGAVLSAAVAIVSAMLGVVLVPLAWLNMGTLVFGAELSRDVAEADAEQAPAPAAVAPAHLARLRQSVGRHGARLGRDVLDRVIGPLADVIDALRLMAVGSVLPMALFCLLFTLTAQAATAAAALAHQLIGPHPAPLAMALEPFALLAGRLCYFVLVIALMAAAVERTLARVRRAEPELTSPASARQAAPASASPAAPASA